MGERAYSYLKSVKRSISFLLSFILISGAMLSGVGPFEAFVEKVYASQGATTAYGYTASVGDTTYGADGVPMNGGGVVPGAVIYNDIDVCKTGLHPAYGSVVDIRGVIEQGGHTYEEGEHFWDHTYVGRVYKGNASGWYAPCLSTTWKWIDQNINCQVRLLTQQFPMPYGHDYRYCPEYSDFILSMIYPELASGDKYVNSAWWEVLTTGEGRISRLPAEGQIIPLHRYFINDTPYELCYRLYPTKEEAEAADAYTGTIYSDTSPIWSVRNSVGWFGPVSGDSSEEVCGQLFREDEDIPAYSYTVAKICDASFVGKWNPATERYDTNEGKVINVYPSGALSQKFRIGGEYTVTGVKLEPGKKITHDEVIDIDIEELIIDYYSMSSNRVSENEVKRRERVKRGNPYQFVSSIDEDGETVNVDEWKVLGVPTAQDPVLSLKVEKEYIAHNDTHELEYTSLNSTYHSIRCKEAGCVYEKFREKHTLGDWVIDTKATESTNGRRHKKCRFCDYETEPESYGQLAANEVDLGDVYRKYRNASKSATEPTVENPVFVNTDTELVMSEEFKDLLKTEQSKWIYYLRFCLYKDRAAYSSDGEPDDKVGLWDGRDPDCRYAARTYIDKSADRDSSSYGDPWIEAGKKMTLGSLMDAYFEYAATVNYPSDIAQRIIPVKEWYESVKDKQWEIVYQQRRTGNGQDTWYISAVPTDQPKPGDEVPPHEHHFGYKDLTNETHTRYCLKDDKAVRVSGNSVCDFNDVTESHDYGDWQVGTEANGHAGKHFRECRICHHVEEGDHAATQDSSSNDRYYYRGSESAGDKHVKVCETCNAPFGEEACSFGSPVTTVEATHKHVGETTKTCSKCRHKVLANTPQIQHTWSDTGALSWNQTSHWRYCTDPGCSNDPEINLNRTHHDLDTQVLQEATCTTGGRETVVCKTPGCGYSESEREIPALQHDFSGEWQSDDTGHWKVCRREGCGTEGAKTAHTFEQRSDGTHHWQECTVCGFIMDKVAHSVNPDEPWVSGNAVSHYHTCTVCGGHADEEAHTYGEWTVTKEATETEEGSRERTCSVCGYIQTDVIAKHVKPTEDKKADDGNTPVPPPSNTITAETKNVVLVTKNAYSITGGMTPVSTGKKDGNPYTVGNKKILSIDKNGKIKVKKAGTTTITFTTADGATHTVTVTVEKPKKQNQTVTDPNKTVIDAKDLLKGATYSEPDSITSTKSGVATVGTDGKIHIVGKGTTKIKYTFGKLKVKATLKVKVEPNKSEGNLDMIGDETEAYPEEAADEAVEEAAEEATYN